MIDLLPLRMQYCEAVAQIAKECLPEHWSLEGIRDVLHYDHNIYYVACNVEKIEDKSYNNAKKTDFGQMEEDELSVAFNKIVGFAGIMLIADEAELLNIAVTPSFQGCGIGQALLKKMIVLAKEKGCKRMLLEVRESNTLAMNLYDKNGFVRLGERKDYYSHPRENAIIMERKMIEWT